MFSSNSRRVLITAANRFCRASHTRGFRSSGTLAKHSLSIGKRPFTRANSTYSSISRHQQITTLLCNQRTFSSADLPSHEIVTLPALSPTMEQGTIIKWEKQEGDTLEDGDIIAQVETDKATMDMETPATGYLAKILVPAGSKDLPLGKVLAIIVENESDIAAFKDYDVSDSQTTATTATPIPSTPPSEPVGGTVAAVDLPSHEIVPLPALSPTMEQGTIIKWEKQEGDTLEDGDIIAQVETDKATMDMETPATGYLAKILVPAGTKDIPLGKVLAIVVENESDIPAFKDYVPMEAGTSPSPQATPTPTTPLQTTPTPLPTTQAPPAVAPTLVGGAPRDRILASPFARKIASEKGIDIQAIKGSGPDGRIISKDVLQSPQTPAAVATPTMADYQDFNLTGMRKTIAARLLQSKQTIPHYYLSIDIKMDNLLKLRKEINNTSNSSWDFKLSVNDFIVKASSLALMEIPQVNSSWMDTFIRQYTNADISVAVSTDGGLITPIIFNANNKGLKIISSEMKELAEKARNGRLQPHEFQGGTFTISNLGMFGIRNFSAVINPPQSCILAIGGTQKIVVPSDEENKNYETASVMSVTMSCDHRVVDGAVGAQWLSAFRSYLENPYKMLL